MPVSFDANGYLLCAMQQTESDMCMQGCIAKLNFINRPNWARRCNCCPYSSYCQVSHSHDVRVCNHAGRRKRCLGSFASEREAAEAYDKAALTLRSGNPPSVHSCFSCRQAFRAQKHAVIASVVHLKAPQGTQWHLRLHGLFCMPPPCIATLVYQDMLCKLVLTPVRQSGSDSGLPVGTL